MVSIAPRRNTKRDRPASEHVARLRLLQLQHSDDPQAAAIATATWLLLARVDRLLEAMGAAA